MPRGATRKPSRPIAPATNSRRRCIATSPSRSLLTYTRTLTATFAASAAALAGRRAAPAAADAPAQHVLLMGFPRSGTTLLEVILDGHPQVVSLEEHDLFTEGVLRYLR